MPAPQQQQGGGGGSDNSLDFLWMIVLIVGGLALTWFFGREYIVAGVLKARLYEIYLIEYVLRSYAFVAGYLHLPLPNVGVLNNDLAVINSKPVGMSLQQLMDLSNNVGRFLMIPAAFVITIMAIITYFVNITERFKHVYSMDTLRKSEYHIWPQITPVMRADLVKKDLDEGPWATSLTPMLFAKKNKLLIEHKENGKTTVTLNEGAAYRVMSLQVGQFWRDIDSFPLHIQALYAIFLARANQDRKVADKLLAQIGASATSDRLNFAGVAETVAKHKNSKFAKYVEKRHSYMLPLMATLLELARTDGVLATAEFLWLKPIDRPLWYMLNSVGRQTAFPEVSGAYAHWLAEKKFGRPLRVPMIDEAVKALDWAIKEVKYEPEDE
ncbi:MAG: type IVB secretion system coupling complex protein DotM/IcmP [Gammaproteobacteria bacterium]|nr:type IVB secretion system coupling complex protein DotM/IcmP [Gammaproteobacteria bacterium]